PSRRPSPRNNPRGNQRLIYGPRAKAAAHYIFHLAAFSTSPNHSHSDHQMERFPTAATSSVSWPTAQVKSTVWLDTRWPVPAIWFSSVAIATLLYALVQRFALREVFTFAFTAHARPDYWLFPASVIATTL